MTINIKYRPLKAFLLTAENGSFSRAAGDLGVTQPSLTALIHDLEHILGVRLFERSTRSIALTDAGRELLERTQRPIADVEEAYRAVLDLSAARRGTVVVGALPSAAMTLVAPALQRLKETHPGLSARVVEAHNDTLLAMVRSNQIELAVATVLGPTPDLRFAPLVDDCFCAVFPADHPLAQSSRIRWTDLRVQDLIMLAQGSSAREQFERAQQRASRHTAPPPRSDVTNMVTAVGLARRGLGVAVLPRLALPELNLRGLLTRTISASDARRVIGLLSRNDRMHNAASRAFVDALVAVVPEVEAALSPMPGRVRR